MGLAVYASRLLASGVLIGIVLSGSTLIIPATAGATSKKAKAKVTKTGPAKSKATKKPAKYTGKSRSKKPVTAKAKASAKPAKRSVARTSGSKRSGGKAVASSRRGGRRGAARTAHRGVAKAVRPRLNVHLPNVPDVEILSIAARHLGTPYRFGGATVHGFDCSGFTRTVFSEIGLDLPHSAREQFTMGAHVATGDWEPGDLVFFHTYRAGASHVGIFLGEGLFIHANSTGGRVRVDSMQDRYYRQRYVGARRMLRG